MKNKRIPVPKKVRNDIFSELFVLVFFAKKLKILDLEKNEGVRFSIKLIPNQAFSTLNIFFYIQPKSNKKINNQWRAHRNERNIDKIKSYPAGSNSHFLPQITANSKG